MSPVRRRGRTLEVDRRIRAGSTGRLWTVSGLELPVLAAGYVVCLLALPRIAELLE